MSRSSGTTIVFPTEFCPQALRFWCFKTGPYPRYKSTPLDCRMYTGSVLYPMTLWGRVPEHHQALFLNHSFLNVVDLAMGQGKKDAEIGAPPPHSIQLMTEELAPRISFSESSVCGCTGFSTLALSALSHALLSIGGPDPITSASGDSQAFHCNREAAK